MLHSDLKGLAKLRYTWDIRLGVLSLWVIVHCLARLAKI